MSIEDTYKEVLISDYIKNNLKKGIVINASDIQAEIETIVSSLDLISPRFISTDNYVIAKTASSAESFKNTFIKIHQDIRILYKEMIRLSKVSGEAFERWKVEAINIEKILIDLDDRIENLLLLTQDTEGFHSILVDNFTDTAFVDLDLSTILPNLATETIEMGSSNIGNTRIFLNELVIAKDVSFKIRTSINFLSRQDAINTNLTDLFKQTSASWWTNIEMKSQKSVTCELTVQISQDNPIALSKISLDLHHSSESSSMNITPLYSIDNQVFTQLPSTTFTQEVRSSAVFSFSRVQAKYIKFLLTKEGSDPSSSTGFFSYQFGFKEISFYDEGFDTSQVQQFFSKPLSIATINGPQEFKKLTLEVCERVESNTEINYFITSSNNSLVPINEDTLWLPLSPINRIEQLTPAILNVGDIIDINIGDTENNTIDNEIVTISYDGRSSDPNFVNPGRNFYLLSKNLISGAIEQTEIDISKSGTIPRYTFSDTNDRILNYQIDDYSLTTKLDIDEDSLIIFRNVGNKGFDDTDISTKVRDTQRGWKFEDPYYSCIVEITNPEGWEIDVGDKTIFIDDTPYINKIDQTILTGKTKSNNGLHLIKVHKNNWVEVVPNLGSLSLLKSADILYPFNHKLIIEGYKYNTSYLDTEEKIYDGVDLFAEEIMKKISIFDLSTNVDNDRYNVYALDRDAPKSHEPNLDNEPSRVFVIKIDESNPDFQNERFVIRFNQVNELRKYLKLRADFVTEDETVSATLHSYKIKLG